MMSHLSLSVKSIEEMYPIFVVGMNGSGTSMLTESVGRHPCMYAFPGETRMIPHYIDRASRFGDLNVDENFCRYWKYVVSSAPDFEIFNADKTLMMPDNWREFPRTLAAILDAVFRQFAGRDGSERWVEKSPNNSERMLDIAALFPNARFVQIIRDGRDCAASVNRRQHRNSELTIYRWRQVVKEARRQGHHLGDRYFELRYEDLTQDPEYWMRKVCRFIELDYHPDVLKSSMPQSEKYERHVSGGQGEIEPNSGKYFKYFSTEKIRKLESISGELLRDLGYDISFDAGSADIAPLKAKLIRSVDFLKANRRLVGKLSGKQSVSWRALARWTLASIREYSSKKY